jgi:hypothetical protein
MCREVDRRQRYQHPAFFGRTQMTRMIQDHGLGYSGLLHVRVYGCSVAWSLVHGCKVPANSGAEAIA